MPFQIVRNDITKMKADAIVNTANYEPVCAGGTDRAIYRAAGEEELLALRRKIGRIRVGEAAVTPALGLDAEYIIHTVGPLWQGGNRGEEGLVRRCYRNSLRAALECGCESIAFPLISTGVCGFPKGEGLRIALSEIGDFLAVEEMTVYLVVFDGESFEMTGKLFGGIPSYIHRHYVEEKQEEEYGSPGTPFRPVPFQSAPDIPPVPFQSAPGRRPMPVAAPAAAARQAAENHLQVPKFLREGPSFAPEAPVGGEQEKRKRGAAGHRVSKRSLEEVVSQVGETFQERLFRLIDQRGLTDVEVYKKANIDRKLFSKIRCNVSYRPGKSTALALAVALELNLDETRDLLARAEMALSPSSRCDLIISYFIEQGTYDIYSINLALFQYGEPMLGA